MMRSRRQWCGALLAALLLAAGLAASTCRGAEANGPLEAAQGQFESGAYPQAIQTLESAIAKAPQDARLHFWLARCHFELRNYSEAVASAERAVQLDAKNSEYHLWLGHSYGREAKRKGGFSGLSLARRTKREFEEAVRLDGSNLPARRALVDYLSEAPGIAGGDDAEARKQIGALEGLDPVEAQLAWADYWNNNDELNRADQALQRALQLKPARVEPYLEASKFYEGRGNTALLRAAVDGAVRVNANEPRLLYYRGVLLVMQGTQASEAEGFLREYLNKVPQRWGYPSHAAAHEWLGMAYEKLGNRAKAIEHYQKALSLDPKRKAAKEGLKRLGR